LISIGTLAKIYGQLPSQVRDTATTYDLMVADIMMSWESQRLEEMKGGIKTPPKLTQEQMQSMVDKVKKGK
jgi:hypothetical protein